ncbi:hypothetical protein [Parabacteroides faecis]|uniref:Anti-sigma regulatory factor (Ser/Thr protein kinase) n=1 Tax=Parabacteroides faecis TaxID=1217282 RepID=A0ABR6KH35_9BACT|nr:hypothetical protein [Parabacteroides faecis]MBB4620808.1 anti-sigma regulatory factor (Ser/Thr protein kinase) [Parabacteroides faecis]GGJ91625.1 hypothetical protein GCM10007084_14150 [Parabacteroides faecis]
MTIFYLNKVLYTNKEGYNSLALLFNQIIQSDDVDFSISFSKTTWFEANLSAVLGAIIRILEDDYLLSIKLIDIPTAIYGILTRNGFIGNIDYSSIDFSKETVVTFQQFAPNHDTAFDSYLKRELLVKKDFPKHTSLLGKRICTSIFEVFENARTHGKCQWIHTCGQYYPQKHPSRFDITVVDAGKTIHKNVNDYFQGKAVFSASDAIDWAIQYGHTTKKEQTGGLGLDLLKEFVKLNKGKIQIVSATGYWEFTEGQTSTSEMDYYFPGTIVTIEFNFDDTSFYMLKEELDVSPDNIF